MLAFSGTYTGNGTTQTIQLPFAWNYIQIKAGLDSVQDTYQKTTEMAAAASIPVRSDAGTATNRIASNDPYSFTVGSNNAVNQSAYPFYYLVLADDGANDYSNIFFPGDSSDDKLVFPNWQPAYAFLKSESAIVGARKFFGQISATGTQTSNSAMPNFQGAAARSDLIYFGSDGLRVSNGSNSGGNLVNVPNFSTFGFAVKNITGLAQSGSYTGTGAALTISTGVNNPIYIDIHADTSGKNPTIQYLGEQSGGLTHAWDSATSTGKITSVSTTGDIVLGTDANVNLAGTKYWYAVIGQNTKVKSITGVSSMIGVSSFTL